MACSSEEENPLGLDRCIVYALPCLGTVFVLTPISVLQGIYAKYYGLTLTTIATALLLTRFFDAITDPLIGHLSDRYYARTGSRKPFIAAGGILLSIGSYFLYSPPEQVTVLYFTVWLTIVYLGWTLFEIPHMTWGGELAKHSKDKSKIYGFRLAAGYFALALFYTIPFLPIFNNSSITPETLRLCGILGPVIILTMLFVCLRRIPNDDSCPLTAAIPDKSGKDKVQSCFLLMHLFFQNRPFLLILAISFPMYLAIGMWYGLIFIYVDSYLDAGAQFAGMALVAYIIAIASIPFWQRLAATFGNKVIFAAALTLMMASFLYTGLLIPTNANYATLILLKGMGAAGQMGSGIISLSLLSEAADYTTWKFGVNRTGTQFSIFVFLSKTSIAVSGALGLAIVGWYGFDPALSSQTEATATAGLTLAIVWLPAGLILVSLGLIVFIRIDGRRHDIVRRRVSSMHDPIPKKSKQAAASHKHTELTVA